MDTSTMQKMVNKSHEWFVKQLHPQGKVGGSCAYFNHDGSPACVLGLFLPPSLAGVLEQKGLNMSGINSLLDDIEIQGILKEDSATTLDELFDDRGRRFLGALQAAHDGARAGITVNTVSGEVATTFAQAFEYKLRLVCAQFELDNPAQRLDIAV